MVHIVPDTLLSARIFLQRESTPPAYAAVPERRD
jgi:hypothetical protein